MSTVLKNHKSYTEQLYKLKEHGLLVENNEKAIEFLQTVNYYRLTGYLYEFKNQSNEKYSKNITFNRLIGLS